MTCGDVFTNRKQMLIQLSTQVKAKPPATNN